MSLEDLSEGDCIKLEIFRNSDSSGMKEFGIEAGLIKMAPSKNDIIYHLISPNQDGETINFYEIFESHLKRVDNTLKCKIAGLGFIKPNDETYRFYKDKLEDLGLEFN